MKTFVLIAALLGLLLLALIGAALMWIEAGDVDMSLHGFIALTLGIVLTLALGVGLMALMFYSNRHGHDDRAGR